MSLASHLSNFTTLTPPELSRPNSPAERERRKTSQQRAEDVIYTLNHAVTCLSLTDFLIAPFFQSVFGWNICGHDHGKNKTSGKSGGGDSSGADSGHIHGPGCGHQPVNFSKFDTPNTVAEKPLKGEAVNTSKWKQITPEQHAAQQKLNATTPEQDKAKLDALFKVKRFDLPNADSKPANPEHAADFVGPPKPPEVIPAPKAPTAHPTSYSAPAVPYKPQSTWARGSAWLKEKYQKLYPNFKEWFIGEAVGDLGAVPVTLAVQHFTPGVMTGIQHVLEPVVGGLLKSRANKAAEKWADANGIAREAKECIDHAQELYTYEMRHLPQMAVWTVSSCLINYGVMKYRNPAMALGDFTKAKAAGAGITAAIVFGTRSLVPDKAHQWDEMMGRKVVVPLTKKVGKLFGIEEHEVEAHQKRQAEDAPKDWKARVKESNVSALRGA